MMSLYGKVLRIAKYWTKRVSRLKDRAIRRLKKSDQNIIHLDVIEGNSLRLAGKVIGVSAMTVQRRLKRASATLKERLNSDQSV